MNNKKKLPDRKDFAAMRDFASSENIDIPEDSDNILFNMIGSMESSVNYEISGYDVGEVCLPLPCTLPKEDFLHVIGMAFHTYAQKGYYVKGSNTTILILLITREGLATLHYDGMQYTLRPGDVFLINCMKPFYYTTDHESGWKHDQITMYGAAAGLIYEMFHSGGHTVFRLSSAPDIYKEMLHLKELMPSRRPDTPLMIHSSLTQILSACVSTNPVNATNNLPELVERACTYMDDHYAEPFSLDIMSSSLFANKHYLCRIFKHYMNKTLLQYFHSVRIWHATILLTSTALPIQLISEQVGYPYLSSFFDHFKKSTGMSPDEYRKRMQA